MTITSITSRPAGSDLGAHFVRSAVETGFLLTLDDQIGIERLLRRNGTKNAPNPPLLNGFLRHKLRMSRGVIEPAPPELIVAGCHVTYMTSGEGARSGVLAINPAPISGNILVASLLGATLIGMRKLQKGPLLRDDGRIDTLFVLDVSPAPNPGAV